MRKMMSRDYRETLAEQLKNTDFRRDLAQVMFEQDGLDGLRMWQQEVARADAWNEAQGHAQSRAEEPGGDFAAIRAALNSAGLDFAVVPLK